VPYLTPDEIPEDDDCRPLSIPASTAWLAIVSGALTELTKPYNWQQFGAVTVSEAVTRMQQMIDDYYAGCDACVTPAGAHVFRLTEDGVVEELLPNGEWGDPYGDAELPPVTPREGGTPLDQICLAAKNAVNVYEQLYENLTDSFSIGLSQAAAAEAFILSAETVLGLAVASITFGIASIGFAVFGIVYLLVEYITADVWTEEFSNALTCLLKENATNTDGVVTFDYQAVIKGLSSGLDEFSLTDGQAKLLLQVAYIIQMTGGVNGLNLAGATTAITDDDCSVCGWGVCWNSGEGEAEGVEAFAATWTVDGYQGGPNGDFQSRIQAYATDVFEETTIQSFDATYSFDASIGSDAFWRLRFLLGVDTVYDSGSIPLNIGAEQPVTWEGSVNADQFILDFASRNVGDVVYWQGMTMRGTGTAPEILEPC